MSAQLG